MAADKLAALSSEESKAWLAGLEELQQPLEGRFRTGQQWDERRLRFRSEVVECALDFGAVSFGVSRRSFTSFIPCHLVIDVGGKVRLVLLTQHLLAATDRPVCFGIGRALALAGGRDGDEKVRGRLRQAAPNRKLDIPMRLYR